LEIEHFDIFKEILLNLESLNSVSLTRSIIYLIVTLNKKKYLKLLINDEYLHDYKYV